MLPKLLYQDSLRRWHLVNNTRTNQMEPNHNHQPEELQLLEKIVIQSGELNQQLSVRETLLAKRQVTPNLHAAKNQLETQLAHSILELRQAYQEIKLQIIENERTQKLLEEQAELLDLVHDAILIRDLNNIITFWNQGAERMYGFPEHEALARPYNSLLKTQYPRPLSEIQAELFQKGCWEGELIHSNSDGIEIAVCSRWVLRKNGKSQLREIIEINKNVTVTKDTEEALFAVGVRLAGILDSAKDAIISLDEQGKITLFNQGAEKIFGYSAAEVLRQSINFLISFDSLETSQSNNNFDSFIQATKKSLENYQVFGKHKNGTKFPIEASASQLELVTGKVFTLILRDITQRVQTEEALRQSEEIYRKMFQVNQAIMLISEPVTGLIVDANTAAYSFYGYSPEKLKQMKVTDLTLLPPEQVSAYISPNNLEKQGCFYSRHKIASGEICDVEIYSSPITRQGQELIYSVIYDITDRQKSQESLQKTNEKLTRWVKELEARNQEIILLGEMSNILQACLTTEEAYNTVAQLIEPLFPNMSGAVFVISNSKQLVSAVASWGNASATTEMLFTPDECWGLRRGRSHLMEASRHPINCKHSHHDSPNVESLCVPMMAQGEALGILYLSATEIGVLTQAKQQLAITVAEQIALAFANLKLHEALQQQSIRDPLTSLFNRRYLEESLEREISRAERQQQTVGIIMLDVDHFKRFNDTFGHDAGDTLLRELGIFIKKNIRGSDIACRFGGEEFLVILPEASLEVSIERAEQIREGIKHLNLHNRQQQLGTITLSLGIAMFPQHGMTGEMVIQAADSALYQAKGQGRDCVIVAS